MRRSSIATVGCCLPSFVDTMSISTRRGSARRGAFITRVTATIAERIANERRLRIELQHDPYEFGANLVRQLAAMGTTHLRSHVDIDPDTKLAHVEALLKLRENFRGCMDMEFVAFPQSGILRSPGVAEWMAEALAMGVEHVGGIDPQVLDGDRKGHLDVVFGLAEKFGKPIDIHLHEPDQIGLTTIKDILARARALGMKDKVTISHGFALGQIAPDELQAVLPQMAELGVRVIGAAPGHIGYPPVEPLLDAGILYAGANDTIQDMWSPWGNGDLLQRAMFFAYRNNYRADAPLLRAFEMVTSIPAQLLGLQRHGLKHLQEGAAANCVVVEAPDIAAAVLAAPVRRLVLKDGVIIGRDGRCAFAG